MRGRRERRFLGYGLGPGIASEAVSMREIFHSAAPNNIARKTAMPRIAFFMVQPNK
jgi:hypothetical protein